MRRFQAGSILCRGVNQIKQAHWLTIAATSCRMGLHESEILKWVLPGKVYCIDCLTFLPGSADLDIVRNQAPQFGGFALLANRRDPLRLSVDARTTPVRYCRLAHRRSGLPGYTWRRR